MDYRRYGDFQVSDYVGSLVGIALLFIFAATSFVVDLQIFFVIFPLSYALFWLWSISSKLCERFIISANMLTIKGRKAQTIVLPEELTIVVAYADVRPPFAMRTAAGNETHILKNKYSVSLLHRTPTPLVIEAIHRGFIQKYTNSSVEDSVGTWLIYSFVDDASLLHEIIHHRTCNVIVPESLTLCIPIEIDNSIVYVDKGH